MDKFKKNPNHLLNYCLITILSFLAIDIGLLLWGNWDLDFKLEASDLLLSLGGLLLCGLPSSILHNCAHGNTGTKRVNRFIGEVCGTIMLYGFESFRTGHILHHRYPDNPAYDPHPPRGLSFPRFLVSPVEQTLVVIERAYYDIHGRNATTERNIAWQRALFKATIVLKLLFWALLLGPKWFVMLYLPMYLSNLFVFAHINYATHVEGSDGQWHVVNLNHNLYYRVANFLSIGGYFHKNHHSRPKVFNPAKIGALPSTPFLTYRLPRPASDVAMGAVCR